MLNMVKDLLLNTDGDIDIDLATGDLMIGDSKDQHIKDVLFAHAGEYKQSPYLGVGIGDYVNAPFSGFVRSELERKISLNLESDNAEEVSVKVNSMESIVIDCNYTADE